MQLETNLAKLRGGEKVFTTTNVVAEIPSAGGAPEASLVRAMVQSSAVPSEPGAPIGAHSTGGGRGQERGRGGHWVGRVGMPAVATGTGMDTINACCHWTGLANISQLGQRSGKISILVILAFFC